MIDALIHLMVFLVEAVIIVVATLVIVGGIVSLACKGKEKATGKIQVRKLNDYFSELANPIKAKLNSKKAFKKLLKQRKKADKKDQPEKNIFVLSFDGDIKAKAVANLREEISAVLLAATPQDEVLLKLESPGGVMHGYGLAASQLQRLVDAKIPLTVSVDKVAASGGYLMACIANKIIAAPFSIIGSIGVVAQLPNFYRYLQDKKVDFEQITAGQYKRTMTLFGQNTEADREKMQEDINEAHKLFKDFVQTHRSQLDINQVATGEHWFAVEAQKYGLVDELSTSDDYLLNNRDQANLLAVTYQEPKKLSSKLGKLAYSTYEAFYSTFWKQQSHSKLNL